MNHRQEYCVKHGHDWAYNFDNSKNGWIVAHCLRCDAEQLFFVEGFEDVDMDDDCSEEQIE